MCVDFKMHISAQSIETHLEQGGNMLVNCGWIIEDSAEWFFRYPMYSSSLLSPHACPPCLESVERSEEDALDTGVDSLNRVSSMFGSLEMGIAHKGTICDSIL